MQDRDIVATEDQSEIVVAYRVTPLSMSLNDLEGQFCCLKPF